MFATCVTNKIITHNIVTDLPSVNFMLKTCNFSFLKKPGPLIPLAMEFKRVVFPPFKVPVAKLAFH